MVSRYLVAGGTGNWDSTTNWSASTGGASGASFPVNGDDAFLDGNSAGAALTVNVSSACSNLDCTGYTGTLTLAAALAVSGATFKLVAGMTLVANAGLTLTLSGSCALTTAGKTNLRSISITGAGATVQLQDDLTIVNTLTLNNATGALDCNNKNVTCANYVNTNGALTMGSGTFTCTSSNGFNVAAGTITANTSTLVCSSSTAVFAGNGASYNTVQLTGSGAAAISGANTFANLTRTGTAVKTDSMTITANQTVTGTLTISGNSGTNRMLVASATLGTNFTLTAATVTITNADFRDITGAGAGSWNLSAITGGSGDCGGNSGITFTTPVTRFSVGVGNWSSTAIWSATNGGSSGASVPLPQDTAALNTGSGAGTITTDMPRTSIVDCSGALGGSAFTATLSLSATDFYGSLTLSSGMTLSGAGALIFRGRGSQTITSSTKTFGGTITFDTTGTYTLQDAFIVTAALTHTRGTLTANNIDVQANSLTSTGANTRVLNMGTGFWKVTSTGTIWNFTGSGLTINPSTSTVQATNNTATARTITNTISAINNLSVTAGTGTLTISSTALIGGNLDLTGYTTGFVVNTAINLGGNLTLGTGHTITAGTNVLTLNGTGTQVITTNGITCDFPVTQSGVGGTAQLADNFNGGGARTWTLNNGTLNINGKVLTIGFLSTSNANTRGVNFGTDGIYNSTGSAGTFWNCATATGMTISGTGWIKTTNATATSKTFAGGGLTYPGLWLADTLAGTDTIQGSNTFNIFKVEPGRSIKFTAGITTTIGEWQGAGSSGNVIIIDSTTTGVYNLVKSGGDVVSGDFLNIQHSVATPANTWYAGANSTNNQGVATAGSGWIFTPPPMPLFSPDPRNFGPMLAQ